MSAAKIIIDPGHGGHDTGAEGPEGLEEANTVLTLSLLLGDKLVDLGIDVRLTRETDVFIELYRRCEIANDWGADFFISVHLNSNGSTAVGIETLYTTQSGYDLATPIHEALIVATGDVDRGLKERNDLYVLNGTAMPAVLLELGFISHPPTETKLRTPEYQNLLIDAVVLGLQNYFKEGTTIA